ncbi:MAG: hypothetical protein H6733_00975 [Alphaproteobacteria bacterium]|nr:hypothetical protein [Alphaproteobacteria bacterium]
MFGYDADELEGIRRRSRRRFRPWVAGPLVVVLLLVTLPFAVLDRLYRPGGLQPLIDRASRGGGGHLRVDDVEMLPVGTWRDVASWRFVASGVGFTPVDPKKPDWSVRRITMTVPSLRRDGGRVIHWKRLDGTGLVIHAHQQRPPPPWEPGSGPIAALSTDLLVVHDALYDAPEDPPLGRAHVEGIVGSVRHVVYRPGSRSVSGEGSLRAASFLTGSITLDHLDLPTFTLDDSSLRFDGSVGFAGNRARLSGDVKTFHIKPDVSIRVDLTGARLRGIVEVATGRDSPVDGRIDLVLTVRAGGKLPRGGAIMTGQVRLEDGRLQLERDTRYVILDLIRIAPWVRLNAARQVEFETMFGEVELRRGTVTLKDLRYPINQRQLRLDGTIDQRDLYLLIHLLAPADHAERPGLGAVIETGDGRLGFRLATRNELLGATPWVPLAPADPPSAPPADP